MLKLTSAMLIAVMPTMKVPRASALADLMNEVCPKYGIDTADRYHEFLATCAHESGEFAIKEERLGYSAERMKAVFGFIRNHPELAPQLVGKPEALANVVYADKNRAPEYRLGNNQDGDGWAFRGGGFIQITGRDMYTRYARYKKVDVRQLADLVRTNDRWALDSACWVFAIEKQLLDEADADQFQLITRRINGGLNGLEDRVKYYERAKKAIA